MPRCHEPQSLLTGVVGTGVGRGVTAKEIRVLLLHYPISMITLTAMRQKARCLNIDPPRLSW